VLFQKYCSCKKRVFFSDSQRRFAFIRFFAMNVNS